jgi:CBS-domain-containing membrane protein
MTHQINPHPAAAAAPLGYFAKMKGGSHPPPGVRPAEIAWSWLGAFLGIGAVAWLNQVVLDATSMMLMIGSFGASAVLVYGAVRSPLAQPRNLVGGHVLSALVGVACRDLVPQVPWLAAALAVATAIAVMHMTRTLHPPGGATALIAVIGGAKINQLGFLYAVMPVASGAVILLVVGLLVNNLSRDRRYPEYWW